MITQIDISNFRSIRQQSIPLKKLNILYGQNGSGKSSIVYGMNVLKNFYVNPNQSLDSLFNLGFIHLGGYSNVVSAFSNKGIKIEVKKNIKVDWLRKGTKQLDLTYGLNIADHFPGTKLYFDLGQKIMHGDISISFPYTLFLRKEYALEGYKFIWNGLTFDGNDLMSFDIASTFNSLYEEVKLLEIISVRRGFFSPIFSTEQATEESLFAMQIRNEGSDFEGKIDYYFKQLFNKTFRFVAIPGSTSFYLRTQNNKGFTTDLVNEGFGVNQTLYMLIKLLKTNTSLAFIEEPEIHLHPSAQSKLVDVFAEIVQKENKQIFLTTHSENIVSSVLAKIANGELDKNDVQFYLAKNEDDETKIIPQEVNDKGQIDGGLMNFMETELSNLKTLLGV